MNTTGLHGKVKVSYLTEEELDAYRKKTENSKRKRGKQVVDWRWPQNRKKKMEGESNE